MVKKTETGKMLKDKMTSIRINSEIFEALKERGVTPQSIIDDYISEVTSITLNLKSIKKRKQS